MTPNRPLAVALLLFATLAATGAAAQSTGLGVDWRLESDGEAGRGPTTADLAALGAERAPTLAFDGERVGGLAGCNGWGARVDRIAGRMIFRDVVTTKKACPPPGGRVETAYLFALKDVRFVRIEARDDGDRLVLRDEDERALLVFRAAQP